MDSKPMIEVFKMKKILMILVFSLLISLLLFFCHTLAPEYGDLEVSLLWEISPGAKSAEPSRDIPRTGAHQDTSGEASSVNDKNPAVPSRSGSVTAVQQSVSLVRFTIMPGNIIQEFSSIEPTYTIQLELGIYNILIEALDASGNTVFSNDTTKVLVQPFQKTSLSLTMMPEFPASAPQFVGLAAVNTSISGEYTLAWSSAARAETYVLEEGVSSGFASANRIHTGSQTYFQVTNRTDGTYYYRVRGENAAGASPWSSTVAFEVTLTELLLITTETVPNGTVDKSYSARIEAAGGVPPYQWSITAGTLPPGLTADGNQAFEINGTPEESGTYVVTVTVTDAGTVPQTASMVLIFTILPATPPLMIVTSSLADGTVGMPYSETIYAEGGSTDRTWEITQGLLPDGLTLTELTEVARISGTPSAPGSFSFTVKVSDNQHTGMADSAAFTVTILQPVTNLAILTESLPDGIVNSQYAASVDAEGGNPPYQWDITAGDLPDGLAAVQNGSLDISGVPAETGTWELTVQVTDQSVPPQMISRNLSITIHPEQLVIITNSLPGGSEGVAYQAAIQASGGILPYKWNILEGTLPPGLEMTPAEDLQISGIPAAAGAYPVTVQVKDSNIPPDSASRAMVINISPPPLQIKTSLLDEGYVNAAYSDRIRADGGSGDRTWTMTAGSLPPGLSFTDECERALVDGIPTAGGTFYFTVRVQDNVYPNMSDTETLFIKVNQLRITTSSLPNATSGVSYSYQLQAADGQPPYYWSETPASASARAGSGFAEGIYINSGGVFSGNIQGFPETGSVEFRVTDSSNPPQVSTKTFQFRILAGDLGVYDNDLENGTVGIPYNEQIIYRRGTPPLHAPWTFSGDWPIPGLSVSYSGDNYHLSITGTPTANGTYHFNITIFDSSSPQKSRTDSYTIVISP